MAVLALAKQYSRTQLDAACRNILDRHEVPSVRKVAEEIQDIARHQQPSFADTEPPLSTAPTPRPSNAQDSTKTHVRGKKAFRFKEEF